MTHEIISLDKIRQEAQTASRLPGDINHHCPHPFGSDAAHAFKAFFNVERARIKAQNDSAKTQNQPEDALS